MLDAQSLIGEARASGRRSLTEAAAKDVLAGFGIAVPKSVVVRSTAEVESCIGRLSAPFALKIMSPDILHKSDAGCVALDLESADAVCKAMVAMATRAQRLTARVDGFLIEEMSAPGLEVVIGSVRDRQFGQMIMIGLGGIFVEILRDVAFRLCPISECDAQAMLLELRGAKLLEGTRGSKGIDTQALARMLVLIGGEQGLLMTLQNEVAEMDVNPLIVSGGGAVAVDARMLLTDQDANQCEADPHRSSEIPVVERFEPLMAPSTVAVLGASSSATTIANTFIRRLKAFGYQGTIYPIHPKANEIEGLACYPALAETPELIDYAYVAIGARAIPDVLRDAGGRVKFAQVISSGFGEVADGVTLEADLVAKAHAGGCRLLGPNCLGLYSPRGGVTFPVDAPKELGTVGVVCQSGGLGTDIIKRGQWRGLRFSGVVTVGNSADIGPVDLLEFYLADPATRVIGLYVEDIKHGRRFFDLLRGDRSRKPVVVLRGGRSSQGRVAAASHTGAMAADEHTWDAVSKQTGCVLVNSVDQFINALLAFQFLALRDNSTRRVVLFGNGGGTSVLAADSFAERGMDVSPFDVATRARLEAMNLPPGTSIVNPIDAPVATLQQDQGRIANSIFDVVVESAAPDALVMHINLAAFVGRGGVDPVDNLIQAAVRVQEAHPRGAHFVVVLRVDGSPELDERRRHYRGKALLARIPVYDELVEAADALHAVGFVEGHWSERIFEERAWQSSTSRPTLRAAYGR